MYTLEQAKAWRTRDVKDKSPRPPENELSKVYDTDDNVLFGSNYTKGKVAYVYVPAEKMETGRPFILYISISYDGIGNADLPAGSLLKPFKELPEMFPDNQFS